MWYLVAVIVAFQAGNPEPLVTNKYEVYRSKQECLAVRNAINREELNATAECFQRIPAGVRM